LNPVSDRFTVDPPSTERAGLPSGDADLASVAASRASLPEHVRLTIIGIVRATRPERGQS
jgi:hypothetical protein